MNSVSAIAQSGLRAADVALAVSANDVANVETDGFVPARVEDRALAGGGVTADVRQDPLDEVRADRALLAPSRTDLVQEALAQSNAVAAYRANLATLESADETDRATLDLVR
jgi:flagellar basal body rod protein FlgC